MTKKLTNNAKDLIPYFEIGVDAMLNDGLIKDIPMISTLSTIMKLPRTISDKIFYNKIDIFLQSFKDVPKEERIQFLKKLNDEPQARQKASTYIAELLETLNESYKVNIVVDVF
ncbi:hypothetical protein SPBRAN_1704 [uncultured Candidatus Thioglobus sp.]|nr:hypothetical protein SPBRAN_1704 [uncultured Candidatus Thioglobus sp.]